MGDTVITPPLLNHSHYLKGHMLDMLQQPFCRAGWAWFYSLQCFIFPAALQVLCPDMGTSTDKEVACSEDHQAWLSNETLWQPLLSASANPE